jgi:Flp pilus assembly protein TadD
MSSRPVRFIAATALSVVLGLSVAGCNTVDGPETTGSIGASAPPSAPRTEAEWRVSLDVWGRRYRENPSDAAAAVAYARALRATEQYAQAAAVLEQAAMRNPNDMPLLGAYGRALADTGQYAQALDALGRAHTPDNPDWRILNAEGAVLDQMGRHAEARRHYETALRIVPNEPSVLSNLGLSYALTKELKKAEDTLRLALTQPGAEPKVRQNLALVVGLEGRFAEAEQIASAELPAAEAQANVQYLHAMLDQQKDWKRPGHSVIIPRTPAGT